MNHKRKKHCDSYLNPDDALATKHYVTSFKFLGSAVASKKMINCVWMIVKKLPCTEFERENRED